MESVFILQHLHTLSEDRESIKLIGVYCSRDEALGTINRLIKQPGFSKYPNLINPLEDDEVNGFYIDKFKLGEDHWADGFVTV